MDSLIDLGDVAQLYNARETRRRNDQYEQNSLLQQRSLDEDVKNREQRAEFKKLEIGNKLLDDATVPLEYKAKIYGHIAQLAGFPEFDEPQLVRAGDTLQKIGKAYEEKNTPELEKQIFDLGYRFPKMALDNLTLLEKTQGLTQKAEEYRMKLELHKPKLEALEEKTATLQAMNQEYRPVIDQFRIHLSQFGSVGASLYGREAKNRDATIVLNPDVKRVVSEAQDRQQQSAALGMKAEEDLSYWNAQQQAIDEGTSTRSQAVVTEHVVAARQVIEARKAEAEWLGDLSKGTWDKTKYTAFLKAERTLTESARATVKGMKSITDERLALAQTKFDQKTLIETNTSKAGVELLQALDGKNITDEKTISAALAAVTKPYARSGGVDVKELSSIVNNIRGTGTKIFNYDPKPSVAEAGKLASVNLAVEDIRDARKTYVRSDGSIDRLSILSGSLGVPWTQGRTADVGLQKAIEVKLRADTGAAAPDKEMKRFHKQFTPSTLDSDELIRYKLDSFEVWMQTVADTKDPLGALRRRSDELLNEGTLSRLNSPAYKRLREQFPGASSTDIMGFLKKEQGK
jgi:hypothetical protein